MIVEAQGHLLILIERPAGLPLVVLEADLFQLQDLDLQVFARLGQNLEFAHHPNQVEAVLRHFVDHAGGQGFVGLSGRVGHQDIVMSAAEKRAKIRLAAPDVAFQVGRAAGFEIWG